MILSLSAGLSAPPSVWAARLAAETSDSKRIKTDVEKAFKNIGIFIGYQCLGWFISPARAFLQMLKEKALLPSPLPNP
jgi:hypothetical protein